MIAVYKYTIQLTDEQMLNLPLGAEPLHIATQGDQLCLWCRVHTDRPSRPRRVRIVETGHPVDDASRYVGTFDIDNYLLVFHVFIDD